MIKLCLQWLEFRFSGCFGWKKSILAELRKTDLDIWGLSEGEKLIL